MTGPERRAAHVEGGLAPADLVALRRSLEDRFDLNADRLMLHELQLVLREIIGMKVRLEKLVRRAMCVREQIVEQVLFRCRVAADGPRVADERGDLVALHSLLYRIPGPGQT
jgi:hypothetical protein